MSARTKQVLRTVLGLALAVALLGWGFPRFARTTWGEVFAEVQAVSWWQASGFLGLVLVGVIALAEPSTARFLFATPIGLACLTTGLGLDALGAWWMRRLTAAVG